VVRGRAGGADGSAGTGPARGDRHAGANAGGRGRAAGGEAAGVDLGSEDADDGTLADQFDRNDDDDDGLLTTLRSKLP